MDNFPISLKQVLERNPSKKKQILDFLNRFTIIEDVLVDKEIFNYTFNCTIPGCGLCCFAGTLVTLEEINRIRPIVDKLKKYISDSKVRRLEKMKNIFYTKFPVEDFFKLRTWNSSCIFLMEDKRCAIHTYCLDNKKDWINFHFDLCVTYPLRISRKRDIIHIEEELINKEYVYPCFKRKDKSIKNNKKTHLIYYMKNVIEQRFSKNFWELLEIKYKKNH